MFIDSEKIQEEIKEHDDKIARQIAARVDCPHCCKNCDNDGESCRHCGAQLAGFGFGGWFGSNLTGAEKCIHRFSSFGNAKICVFCERFEPANEEMKDSDDSQFWGEIISTYTDIEAQTDGILTDVSDLRVMFNGKIINRIAREAALVLELKNKTSAIIAEDLRCISSNCTFDGDGADAWGIFEPNANLGNEKFWLVPNEVEGYSLILPDEY